MVLELLGTRVVSPYMGSSLYVWTALIGVVLGCLSLGYYIGGELSKKDVSFKLFSDLVFYSAVWVLFMVLLKELLLTFIVVLVPIGYAQALIAALILFGPPSILLGAASPYAARLLIQNVKSSGVTVGRLYALSTLGSITGTFLTGFLLVPLFGHTRILYGIAFLLCAVSVLLSRNKLFLKIVFLLLCLLGIQALWVIKTNENSQIVLDIDTSYSRILLADIPEGKKIERNMIIDGAFSSAVVLGDRKTLPFAYYKFYDLMFWNKNVKDALMIGGAGMGYPRYTQEMYPDMQMTVVEIDPKQYELALQYMDYTPSKNTAIVQMDGRVYLNSNTKKYDAILFDVFSAHAIPPHLASIEVAREVQRALTQDGIVVLNMHGAIEGEKSIAAQAITATYKEVFKNVEVFAVSSIHDKKLLQNLMLVASDTSLDSKKNLLSADGKKLLSSRINFITTHSVLTDDWSPVDNYSFRIRGH